MHPRAIWAIGCGQLVNWGVLYFAFGVFLVPLEQFLGAPRSLIAGAFSLGLFISALAAPAAASLSPQLLARATAALNQHGAQIANRDVIAIADFAVSVS